MITKQLPAFAAGRTAGYEGYGPRDNPYLPPQHHAYDTAGQPRHNGPDHSACDHDLAGAWIDGWLVGSDEAQSAAEGWAEFEEFSA